MGGRAVAACVLVMSAAVAGCAPERVLVPGPTVTVTAEPTADPDAALAAMTACDEFADWGESESDLPLVQAARSARDAALLDRRFGLLALALTEMNGMLPDFHEAVAAGRSRGVTAKMEASATVVVEECDSVAEDPVDYPPALTGMWQV